MNAWVGLWTFSAGAEEWRLLEPYKDLARRCVIPREVGAGTFRMEARLSLDKLDATSASIELGSRLNLGFDSMRKTLFVEGSEGGRWVKMLALTQKHLRAGEAFDFLAMRDDLGGVVVKIDGVTIWKGELKGALGAIAFRPHRGVMQVRSARLTGDLLPPPPPVDLVVPQIPLRRDGSLIRLMELHVRPERASEVSEVHFRVSGGGWLEELRIDGRGEGKRTAGRHVVEGPWPVLGKPMVVEIRVRDSASLDLRPQLFITQVVFKDGSSWQPEEPVRPFYRLAVDLHAPVKSTCHTFRIPGLTRTPKGTLLAVYDMRYSSSSDLQGHMDIGLSRSTDGGLTWSTPRPIMDMGTFEGLAEDQNGCSDPCILVDPQTGRVFVAAVWTHGRPGTHQWRGKGSAPGLGLDTSSQFVMVTSDDDGQTWSKPENWTKHLKDPSWYLFAPAPGNGIALKDGTLVMPTQGRGAKGLPFSNITTSKDGGKTWTVSPPARDDTTECAVAPLADGRLLLNMRDNRNRRNKGETNGRAMAVTADLGNTWAVHSADHGALPEPVCMASMISWTDPKTQQHRLFFSNPHDKHRRRMMTIQASNDNGKTWPESRHVLLDERGGMYSSLVMIDNETVGIVYESSQSNLVFQRIPVAELIGSE